jgi:hypothetical protein
VREDERLTSSNISTGIERRGPIPDEDRTNRLHNMKRTHIRKTAAKAQERKEGLHDLYMQARNFITTTEKLDKVIDELFFDTGALAFASSKGTSIWGTGLPPTVQMMLNKVNSKQMAPTVGYEGPKALTDKRLHSIAEELTGGKMDKLVEDGK